MESNKKIEFQEYSINHTVWKIIPNRKELYYRIRNRRKCPFLEIILPARNQYSNIVLSKNGKLICIIELMIQNKDPYKMRHLRVGIIIKRCCEYKDIEDISISELFIE